MHIHSDELSQVEFLKLIEKYISSYLVISIFALQFENCGHEKNSRNFKIPSSPEITCAVMYVNTKMHKSTEIFNSI